MSTNGDSVLYERPDGTALTLEMVRVSERIYRCVERIRADVGDRELALALLARRTVRVDELGAVARPTIARDPKIGRAGINGHGQSLRRGAKVHGTVVEHVEADGDVIGELHNIGGGLGEVRELIGR